jgi:septum formation protein
VTTLQMRPLSAEECARYVRSDQPLDCAGSYKIERLGIALFERIECADFTAITGLPLLAVAQLLRAAGFPVP